MPLFSLQDAHHLPYHPFFKKWIFQTSSCAFKGSRRDPSRRLCSEVIDFNDHSSGWEGQTVYLYRSSRLSHSIQIDMSRSFYLQLQSYNLSGGKSTRASFNFSAWKTLVSMSKMQLILDRMIGLFKFCTEAVGARSWREDSKLVYHLCSKSWIERNFCPNASRVSIQIFYASVLYTQKLCSC